LLGVFDDPPRPSSRIKLEGNDWALLLYTDGLIEGRSGEELSLPLAAGKVVAVRSRAGRPALRQRPYELAQASPLGYVVEVGIARIRTDDSQVVPQRRVEDVVALQRAADQGRHIL
jgi:hypothetical protein